tara:strand:- start:1121 stop:1981 length:861 start_codon:yes stop_codon:yes gene_type:complete
MSVRNNEERIGATPNQDTPIATNAAPTAGGDAFSYAVPTEHVEIPSGGQYYPEDHPLHNQTTVEIKYMTAKDEDILSSPSLLKKGLALDRLLQNVIVDRNIKADSLYIGDKNALLVASRITGYGPEYNVTVTCPVCGTNSKAEFDLEESKKVKTTELCDGVEHVRGDLFFTVLPKTQVNVEFSLLTGADEKRILQMAESKRKKNLPESPLTDQLRMIIRTVNGSNRPEDINNLIANMPALDGRHLRKMFSHVSPDLQLADTHVCDTCGEQEEVELPLTAEFFWPKQ